MVADPSPQRRDSAMSLRDRRRIRTKYLVQSEALRLFAEKGYPHTTVDDIAHAAAMSPRTFFRYFPSKEDVVLWDEYDEPPLIEEIWRPPLAGDPVAHSVACIRALLCETCEADRERLLARVKICFAHDEIWVRFVLRQNAILRRAFENFAKSWVANADDLGIRVLVAAIFSAVVVAVERWQRDDGREDLGKLYDEAIATLADSAAHLKGNFVASPSPASDSFSAVKRDLQRAASDASAPGGGTDPGPAITTS